MENCQFHHSFCVSISQHILQTKGTVLDLPYCFTADGEVMEMERVDNFDFDFILGITAVCCCVWKVGYKCVECVFLGGLRFLKLH